MPKVEFHSGVAEPVSYACRLLRKAWRQGVRVAVTAPVSTLHGLDRELWTFEPLEFVPHLLLDGTASADALARTPIWLCGGKVPDPGPPVLVNLGAPYCEQPQRFERIIDIVGMDAEQRGAGRERWRAYEALGITIQHHARAAAA